ncbi:hypothetical protein EJ03DRAFT_348453 [Teratosphaeria nubilosa]|uniref:Uncharacterized protein n=1 Tax=Teratosphaeria nubilosa TaxID=161662 RepID=A0A6G1LHW8_9PEZI|nr:hypothetical protein EJ03DRAFT_348453 [Teratosphaeria nubilosa]
MPGPNELIFLNQRTDDEEEYRRQVRSKAAQHSHRVGPRLPKASKGRGLSKRRRKALENEDENDAASAAPIPVTAHTPARQSSLSTSLPVRTTSSPDGSDTETETELVRQQTPRLFVQSHISGSPRSLLDKTASADPFQTYPVPAQAFFPQVLHELPAMIIRGWRVTEHSAEERAAGVLWIQRLVMSDPCYFYANVLSCADNLVHKGVLDTSVQNWLVARLVEAINHALKDPKTALGPGVMHAVGRIAFREIVVGDKDVGQNVHRPAYARMLRMAGGLANLDMPEVCRNHIRWADRILTAATGVTFLEPQLGLRDPGRSHEKVGMSKDVKALDKFLPRRQRRSGVI